MIAYVATIVLGGAVLAVSFHSRALEYGAAIPTILASLFSFQDLSSAPSQLLARIILAAGVLIGLVTAIGIAVLGWLNRDRFVGVRDAGLSYLLGYLGIGALLLGLLLVKLWFPPVLWCALILPAGLCLRQAWACLSRPPHTNLWWETAIIGVFMIVNTHWLASPETHPDLYAYGLAAPGRWLAEHGLSCQGAYPLTHFPLLGEIMFVYPLLLNTEQVARCCTALAFVAGVLSVISLLGSSVRVRCLCMTFILASAPTSEFVATAKNDAVVTGFCLALLAAIVRLRPDSSVGAPVLAGLLAGGMLATKLTGGIALVWMLVLALLGEFQVRRFRRWGVILACVAPIAPWLMKSWLLTGDPIYPIGGGMIPSLVAGWDGRNGELWRLNLQLVRLHGTATAMEVTREIVSQMPAHVLVCGIAMCTASSFLKASWSLCCVVFLVWLFPSNHVIRFSMPLLLAWTAMSLRWSGFANGNVPSLRMAVLVIMTVLSVLGHVLLPFAKSASGLRDLAVHHLIGLESTSQVQRQVFTVEEDFRRQLENTPSQRRILVVGAVNEYRSPRRMFIDAPFSTGQTPLVWHMVHSSWTPDDVLKKFRQLNVSAVAVNGVRESYWASLLKPFVWTERMAGMYRIFWFTHSKLTYRSKTLDHANGAFHLYSIAPKGVPERSFSEYLPGTESLLGPGYQARALRHNEEEVSRQFALTCARAPGVGHFMNMLGGSRLRANAPVEAFRLLSIGFEHDMLDDLNLTDGAFAALLIDRESEAVNALKRALDKYTDRPQHQLKTWLAACIALSAWHNVRRGHVQNAIMLAQEGLRLTEPFGDSTAKQTLDDLLRSILQLARQPHRQRNEAIRSLAPTVNEFRARLQATCREALSAR